MEGEKSTKEVLLDYGREIIGYESGLGRTMIDLIKRPDVVLKSYLERGNKYVSPFKILLSLLGAWGLVSGFLIDWHEVFERYLQRTMEWSESIAPDEPAPFELKVVAFYMGELYSKYFIPVALTSVFVLAFIASRRASKLGADFKSLLAALAYSYSLTVFLLFALSISAYYDHLLLFFIVMIVLGALQALGKGNFLTVSVKKFFPENGKKIDFEVNKAMLVWCTLLATGIFIAVYINLKRG